MTADVLLGLQWGDEGKGKIVDVLAPEYQVIARFQGGPNAGHTLEFNNTKHILHTLPSGIFHEHILNIIGNGVVIDPVILKAEIEKAIQNGADIYKNLIISHKAHLILPSHKLLDAALEQQKGNSKIGSTLKGIGPAYTDKISRNGLRIGDILSKDFEQKYAALRQSHIQLLNNLNFSFDLGQSEKNWFEAIEFLRKIKQDNIEYLINEKLTSGTKVLAEGAQGTLLDVDFGTYPFVTSSNTVCAGACTGLGIPPKAIGRVFGIFKAYCTRVGSGPFPTELNDDMGELIRKKGNEFGSTTGRPRRCGWLDLPALSYAIMINGVTDLIMTKADVLNGLEKIQAATAYTINNTKTKYFPFDVNAVLPVYQTFEAWKTTTDTDNSISKELMNYIRFIEDFTKTKVSILSTGPDRLQTIRLK